MKTATKYFGEVEYEDESVLAFPRGLFGFEEEREFLLLPFSGNVAMFCLQSLATAGLAFIVLDPFSLNPGYEPDVPDKELADIRFEEGDALGVYALCSVRNPVADSTVNLKCPIVVNGRKGLAVQVILEEGPYGMRHKLSEFGKREGSPC